MHVINSLVVLIMIFTTEGFLIFEVAIKSWPEWDFESTTTFPFIRSTRT